MADLIPRKALNHIVANLDSVQGKIHADAEQIKTRAETNLVSARATTTHTKIAKEREHETSISLGRSEGKYGHVDYAVYMDGDDPMATEFGHAPSGYFDPEKFGRVTKAPHGLYILTGAAGFDRLHAISSGKNRGKR